MLDAALKVMDIEKLIESGAGVDVLPAESKPIISLGARRDAEVGVTGLDV